MKKEHIKNSEQGFILVVTLMLLLVTSTMGTVLLLGASGQSQMARSSGEKQQTFLSADTGIQEAVAYLASQAEAGNLPTNSSTATTVCDIPISTMGIGGYDAIITGNNLSYAYRSTNSDSTYESLSAAMELTGDDVRLYGNQSFIYYLSKLDIAELSGSNAGGSVGESGCYSGQCGSVSQRYVVLSCGQNSDTFQRSLVMSVMSVES